MAHGTDIVLRMAAQDAGLMRSLIYKEPHKESQKKPRKLAIYIYS